MTMTARSQDGHRVIDLLKRAFSRVPSPGDSRLVPGGADPDYARVRAAFAGKHWQDVDVGFIAQGHRGSLFLMTPEAVRHFLPAYCIAAIRDPVRSDVALGGIVSVLTRPDTEDEFFVDGCQCFFDGLVRLMTPQEHEAIRAFLAYVRDVLAEPRFLTDSVESALGRYWAAG